MILYNFGSYHFEYDDQFAYDQESAPAGVTYDQKDVLQGFCLLLEGQVSHRRHHPWHHHGHDHQHHRKTPHRSNTTMLIELMTLPGPSWGLELVSLIMIRQHTIFVQMPSFQSVFNCFAISYYFLFYFMKLKDICANAFFAICFQCRIIFFNYFSIFLIIITKLKVRNDICVGAFFAICFQFLCNF